jgi:hypothetical protein
MSDRISRAEAIEHFRTFTEAHLEQPGRSPDWYEAFHWMNDRIDALRALPSAEPPSATKLYAVIDVGCHECGVGHEVVGTYSTREEADAASATRDKETNQWRDGGQTICVVFELLPAPPTLEQETR